MQVLSKIGIQPILLLLICPFITKTEQCSHNLCFNWKLSRSTLTLKCRADELRYRVTITDPSGHTRAACQPPTSTIKCLNYNGKGKISQNPKTNMTTYVIKRMMDKLLNGNWTCKHGTNLDVADVEVFVLTKEVLIKNNKSFSAYKDSTNSTYLNECFTNTILFGLLTYSASLFSCTYLSMSLPLCKRCCYKCRNISSCKQHLLLILCSIAFIGMCSVLPILPRLSSQCKSQFISLSLGFPVGISVGFMIIGNPHDSPSNRSAHRTLLMARNEEQTTNM